MIWKGRAASFFFLEHAGELRINILRRIKGVKSPKTKLLQCSSHPLVFLYTFRTYTAHAQSILRIRFFLIYRAQSILMFLFTFRIYMTVGNSESYGTLVNLILILRVSPLDING